MKTFWRNNSKNFQVKYNLPEVSGGFFTGGYRDFIERLFI